MTRRVATTAGAAGATVLRSVVLGVVLAYLMGFVVQPLLIIAFHVLSGTWWYDSVGQQLGAVAWVWLAGYCWKVGAAGGLVVGVILAAYNASPDHR